ncbi:MAG: FAD-dependent oxidoreductase [Actinobacteria bacterium]|nr:FAD-dependent oxidoreductase [Actinomycetota bacterium]MBU1942627.1 FAD-dependent oxidoreductase [Actinomycetota bacterium]MBU2688697.1 FAD-dependent oxidoreductase [Actinomycetota bacterium]
MRPVVFVCTTPEERRDELRSLAGILERRGVEVHVSKDFCHPKGQRLIRENVGADKEVVLVCKRKLTRDVFEHNFPPRMDYVSHAMEGDPDELAARIRSESAPGEPAGDGEQPMLQKVMVIGGGVAGVYAALDVAEQGFQVTLVESDPSIGGIMAALDKTFPTMDCSI